MSDNDDPFGVSKRKGKTIVMPNPGGRWSEGQPGQPGQPRNNLRRRHNRLPVRRLLDTQLRLRHTIRLPVARTRGKAGRRRRT